MKKFVIAMLVGSLIFTIAGCKKKEEKPQIPPGHPSMEGGAPQTGMGTPDVPKVDRKVVVPAQVNAAWKAVKLSIEDKALKNAKEYTVAVGSEFTVPNSNIKIKVLAFLPDFRMGDKDITSASDKPNNPAAQVVITEPGKGEWKGWLYSMHPAVHPFAHEKFAVTLIGGVKK